MRELANAIRLCADRTEEEVAIEAVMPGDTLRVKPGGKIPVDGEVIDGHSNVDESMITGEPIPAAKTHGSKVTAGTINRTGSFLMRATKVGADALLARKLLAKVDTIIVDKTGTLTEGRPRVQRVLAAPGWGRRRGASSRWPATA